MRPSVWPALHALHSTSGDSGYPSSLTDGLGSVSKTSVSCRLLQRSAVALLLSNVVLSCCGLLGLATWCAVRMKSGPQQTLT